MQRLQVGRTVCREAIRAEGARFDRFVFIPPGKEPQLRWLGEQREGRGGRRSRYWSLFAFRRGNPRQWWGV
ncbi:MAG: hypothetical protein ABSG53_31415, partial [Thermoguttaceae bacterium]